MNVWRVVWTWAWVGLVCSSIVWVPTSALTYGNHVLDTNEVALVLDKAATEMAQLRAGTTDCGVVLTTISAANTPDPPDETRLGWLPESITLKWPSLVSNVHMATTACYGYYDCLGVAVFVTQPQALHPTTGEGLFVVRYMDRNAGVREDLHDTAGAGASGGLWTATYLWDRTKGYACPSDYVDAGWYYNAWQSRLAEVLPEPIPLDVAGATQHFKTVGHLWRLWPNEHCKLTPVLLTAESGCTQLRCPTHTVCPAGYRLQDRETYWCTQDAGPEQSYVDSGTQYAQSYLFSNGGAYVTPPCSYQPGNSDVGGECGYDLTVLDSSNTASECKCHHDVPLGDPACQFVASAHCRGPRQSTTANCGGEGECWLDLDAIDWSDGALGLTPVASRTEYDTRLAESPPRPPPIQCHCDDPDALLQPWCDRSVCSYTPPGGTDEIDCHTDPVDTGSPTPRSGVCSRRGDAYACVCNDLYFGEYCQFHDVFDPEDNSPTGEYQCFVEAADVGVSIPGRLYTECAGHGTCQATPEGIASHCVCANAAYNGTWCQHVACPDCGPYGKCVLLDPEDSPTGEYETTCVCAVHEQSYTTPIAGRLSTTDLDGPCVVDLCLDVAKGRYGSLVVDPVSLASGGDAPPRGRCVCTVSGNGLHNEGLFCDDPVCDRDTDGLECGIAFEGIKNAVCRPCATHPNLLGCAGSVLPVGAVCDCDNAAGDPTPYWLAGQSVDRYTHDGLLGVSGQPTCSLYCLHGAWREESGTHACRGCFQEGFVGDRCDEALCVHGRYDPEVHSLCVPGSCEPGWAGARCNACDPGFGLDDTLGDANPGCDVCLEGWAHPLGLGPAAIADLLTNATCLPCTDPAVAYCSPAGTVTQTCYHDAAPTKFGCVCRQGWAGDQCDRCATGFARAAPGSDCRPEAELVSCGPGTVSLSIALVPGGTQVVDGHASQCVCSPNFAPESDCTLCLAGFTLTTDTSGATVCTPCLDALQCHPAGTESVRCPSPTESGPGACNCFAPYSGDRCLECAAHATYDTSAGACVACGLSCGPNGVPNCDTDPPTCMCFNGYDGAQCDTCVGCGPGGLCSSGAFLASPWCTCRTEDGWRKSTTADTPGATEADIRTAPCDVCIASALPVGSVCRPVREACGYGAHVVASHNAAACFCDTPFLPLAEQPDGKCTLCASGGVGPDCRQCDPGCSGHSHCVWRNDTLRVGAECVCDEGFVDSLLGPCSQCDAPRYLGAFCRPCPEDCGVGVCTVEVLTQQPYCLCPAGSRHKEAGNPQSPCGTCARGETPVSCQPCPICGENSFCAEDAEGRAYCACAPGHARAPGATRQADVCFREDVLELFLALNNPPEDTTVSVVYSPTTAVVGLDEQFDLYSAPKQVLVLLALPLFAASTLVCWMCARKARMVWRRAQKRPSRRTVA